MSFSDYLYEVLNEKIDAMDSNGLFLLPLPTGSGKTFNVIKYIKENYKNKKIFFISNQLKLLPDLSELQKNSNHEEKIEIEKQFLKLPSIFDSFKLFFEKYSNEETIKKYDDLNDLKKYIRCYEENREIEIKEYYLDKFTTKELEFRKKVKKYFNSKSIVNDTDFEYLKAMYPAYELEEKNIIIMSTKKFFLPIDKIIGGCIYLPTADIKNCIIFFDEFDAVKDELLDIIVKNNDYYRIDCTKLIRKIFSNSYNLSGSLLFDDVMNYPNQTEEYINKGNEIISNLKKYIDDYYDLYYRIKYPFIQKIKEENKTFIFKDRRSVLVEPNNINRELVFDFDDEKLTNYIVKENDVLSNNSVKKVIDDCIYLLKNFMFNVLKLARLYYEYNFRIRKDNNFNILEAINSIVDRMDFGQEYKNFLVKEIYNLTKIKEIDGSDYEVEGKRDKRRRRYDFYYDGFSYVKLSDSDNERLETKIYFNMFNLTPEAMMLKVAATHKVIGISATATFDTCIKNFDVNFLKYKLEDKFLELEPDELEEFKELYHNEQLSYSVLIDKTPQHLETLKAKALDIIIDKEEFEKEIEGIAKYYKSKIKDIYNVLIEFEKFLKRYNHHSFIMFLSFSLNNYPYLKEFILKWINRVKNYQDMIIEVIDKTIIENTRINEILTNNKKVFLISCYQTIGVGVNLIYEIPSNKIINYENYIFKDHKRLEKDIDGCFLSKVTNVIPFASRDKELEDELLAKIMYSLEYLKANDEIGYGDFYKALNGLFNNEGVKIGKFYGYKDICIGVARVLVQAIGRICRTKNKCKEVYISYEQELEDFIKPIKGYLQKLTFNKEFEKLLESIATFKNNQIKGVKISNIETHIECRHLLKWPWDQERMKEWLRLRDFVLKHPTANNEDFINNEDFKKYYFKMSEPLSCYSVDKYNYTRKIEYNVSKNSNGLLEKRLYVSADDCKLKQVVNNKYFKDYFENRGYAVDFEAKEYIMSPHLYQTIYKGALGELIGKACFEKYGINLDHINDLTKFELFDYYKDDYYFDFKKWDSSFKISEKEQIDKVNNKMSYGQISKAYIINVLFEGYSDKQIEGLEYNYENKKIVTVSWLYDTYTERFNEGALIDIKNTI